VEDESVNYYQQKGILIELIVRFIRNKFIFLYLSASQILYQS
jgi:hypothetical protein